MKIKRYLTLGTSAAAIAAMASVATGASAHLMYLPYHRGAKQPAPIMLPVSHEPRYVAPKNSISGTWTDVANEPFTGQGGWGPMLLTDGSVIIKHAFTGTTGVWYKLSPNKKGKYTSGTWKQIASMPTGYQPDFYASQVLTNGNVLVEGGEYNGGSGVWTNKGAIYDPVADKWTSVTPPSTWGSIGDSASLILPDGSYLLADCCFFGTGQNVKATISGTTVTWGTPTTTWNCGSSSRPCMDEEGLTPLPNGNVILVDVWEHTSTSDEVWTYDTSAGTWSQTGNTVDYLSTTSAYELGSAPITPKGPQGGTIIQMTGNTSTGVSDVYSIANGTWSHGPKITIGSTVYDMEDAPAATLPDGNILAEASPGAFVNPAHFWEMSVDSGGAVTATQVSDNNTSASSTDFTGNLLMLPTGQALWVNSQSSTEVAVYKPKGHAKAGWLPVVSSVNSSLTVGSTGNAISGKNFNGFDLGGVYGDDGQFSTNYPIVRITNNGTHDVCYARSYNFSTMGVWTTGTTNATFDIPKSCETGASTLQVIVNGIASTGTSVTLS